MNNEPLQERIVVERLSLALDRADERGIERVLMGREGPGVVMSDLRGLLSELERLQALVGRLGRLAANSAYNIRQPEALYDMTDCYRAFQEIADEARQALLVEGGGWEDNSPSVARAKSSLRSDQQAQNSAGGGE